MPLTDSDGNEVPMTDGFTDDASLLRHFSLPQTLYAHLDVGSTSATRSVATNDGQNYYSALRHVDGSLYDMEETDMDSPSRRHRVNTALQEPLSNNMATAEGVIPNSLYAAGPDCTNDDIEVSHLATESHMDSKMFEKCGEFGEMISNPLFVGFSTNPEDQMHESTVDSDIATESKISFVNRIPRIVKCGLLALILIAIAVAVPVSLRSNSSSLLESTPASCPVNSSGLNVAVG